jgi:hypothetical protein
VKEPVFDFFTGRNSLKVCLQEQAFGHERPVIGDILPGISLRIVDEGPSLKVGGLVGMGTEDEPDKTHWARINLFVAV